MNKEEIHNLLKIQNDNTTFFTNQELKMIDDYINELEAYKYNMDRDYLRLEKENQELKKQLEEYKKLGFKHLNDKCNKLEKENQELKEVIDKAIELNKQVIKYIKEFYRPTKDKIYGGTLINIAEQNLRILKGEINE